MLESQEHNLDTLGVILFVVLEMMTVVVVTDVVAVVAAVGM
jgi:hypothetical protein